MRMALPLFVLSLGVSEASEPFPPPPEPSTDAGVVAANQLYAASRFGDAIAQYHVALAARPELAEAWLNLGLAHRAAAFLESNKNPARLDAEIAAFERAAARRPEDGHARDLLISSCFEAGRYTTLLAILGSQAARRPDDAELAMQVARVYTQMGDEPAAIRWVERVEKLATDPKKKTEAMYMSGVLHWRVVRHHPELPAETRLQTTQRGIAVLDEVYALRKGADAPTLSYLGLLYRERATLQKTPAARAADLRMAARYRERAERAADQHHRD
jgi:hypothetical protein